MENQENKIPESDSVLIKELEVSRRRNRLLAVAVFGLSVIFILILVFAVVIYKRISVGRQAFEAMREAQSSSEAAQPGAESVFATESGSLFPSSVPVSSSLTLFTNQDAAAPARRAAPIDEKKIYKALMKYSNRPIIKEFIVELKKDPEMMKVFEKQGSDDPMKMLSDPRTFKSINAVMAKFAFRPDFMKLAMEAMSDPELKPLMRGMPGAGAFRQGPAPGAVPAPTDARREQQQEEDPYYDSEIKFDPSAISGGGDGPARYAVPVSSAPVSRSSAIKRKAPPPVWQ